MFVNSSVIRQLLVTAMLGALAGCATSTASVVAPESVPPAPVSHLPYMGFSCAKLDENRGKIARDLEEQRANLTEKSGPIIARLKGEELAVKQAMGAKKCPQAQEAPKTL